MVFFMFLKSFLLLAFCTSFLVNSAVSNGKQEAANPMTDKQKVDSDTNKLTETKVEKNSKSDLFYILEQTLQYNKTISSAQKNLMAIHENYNISVANFKPTVDANIGYQAGNSAKWNKEPSSIQESSTASCGVTVKQNIFKGGADLGTLNETKANIKAQWSEYESIKQKVLSEVASLYFEIIAAYKEIEHLNSLLKARGSTLEVVSQMYNNGAEKYVSVMEAKAAYAETQGDIAKTESRYKTLCAQFKESTGMNVSTHITAPAKLFNTNMKQEQAQDIALKSNPQIIEATDKLIAAKESVKKPNARIAPNIDLQYGYNQSLDSKKTDENRNNRSHTVGISMTMSIYDGGTARAQKRQATEIASQAAVEKEKIINATIAGIAKTWAELEAAKENIISANVAIEARHIALHDTEEEHKAGIKLMKDVLDAQQKLFEAQSIEVQAQKSYFISQCNALALLGRMTPEYLKLKSNNFDYKQHFNQTKKVF